MSLNASVSIHTNTVAVYDGRNLLCFMPADEARELARQIDEACNALDDATLKTGEVQP